MASTVVLSQVKVTVTDLDKKPGEKCTATIEGLPIPEDGGADDGILILPVTAKEFNDLAEDQDYNLALVPVAAVQDAAPAAATGAADAATQADPPGTDAGA